MSPERIGATNCPHQRLPHIDPTELNRRQEERRKDPDYIQKLLDEARKEFDEKWGIDPNSPTDYGPHSFS